MKYYISRGGQQHGPYAMADLQNMLAQGQLDPHDLAWGEGLSAWTPVSEIVTPVEGASPAPAPAQLQVAGPPQAPSPVAAQAPFSMAHAGSMPQGGSYRSQNVVTRYKTGYRVASVITGLGTVVKVIGIVLAVLYVLAGLVSGIGGASLGLPGGSGALGLVIGIVGGAVVWLMFWLYGTLISAAGWVLKAMLDGAVNSSPFLSDDQRAEAMGI